jgi:hypothetical protein
MENSFHIDETPEWIRRLHNTGGSDQRRVDREEAAAYISDKAGFMWPSDLLEILAEAGRGPLFWQDDISGDIYYRISDIDAWLNCYFRSPIKGGEPYFRTSEFRSKHPVRWLYATDAGDFAYDLRRNLEFWCCDVVEVSSAFGAAVCAGHDVDAAIVELISNIEAAAVICWILRTRGIPVITIVRGVADIPSAIERAGFVLREPTIYDAEKAIISHIPSRVLMRMRLSGVLVDYE